MPLPIIESIQYLNNANGTIVVPSGLVNPVMVVCLGTHQGTISSVTYGAAGLTVVATGRSAFNECGDIWVLVNPTAGSATLSISMSGGSWWGATVFILSGAKQTTTITNNKIDSASGSSSSCAVTPPATNCMIIGSAGGEATYTGSNSPAQMLSSTTLTNSSFENSCCGYVGTKSGMPITFSLGMSSGQRYGMAMACIESAGGDTQLPNGRRIKVGNGMSVSDFAR